MARVAAERGLTHLAITDHGHIEGALEARSAAPAGLTVIVGEEIRSREGDLIALFVERPVPAGLSPVETAAAIREQGGLVGLAHPFDRFRGSLLADRERTARMESLAPLLDYVETFNARVPLPAANDRAAAWALEHGLPGVAVSDAHSLLEVGVAYVILAGAIEGPAALRAALPGGTVVASRASFAVRAITPLAKVIQRVRYPDRFRSRT